MKILLVTPVPPDRTAPGAIPALLYAQLIGLAERHDVTLVTAAGPDAAQLDAATRLCVEGVDVHVAPRTSPRGLAGWRRRGRMATAWLKGRWPWRTVWFWEPNVQNAVDRLLATRTFDVVAIEDDALAPCRLPDSVASVLTEHEVGRARRPLHMGGPREWPGWAFHRADQVRWPRYQRDTWRRFDVVQVFTEQDAADAVRIAPEVAERIRITPFGIDVPRPSSAPEIDGSILFFGNYSHPPNRDAATWLVEEILPRVRVRAPAAELWLAGSEAPGAIRALAQPGVRFLGHVDDLDETLGRAAVVAAPVRKGGGMRMKVVHAMALGKPVVTTTRGTGGLTTGGREPPVAVADDADGIADALVRLVDSPDERAALGARARAFVEEHHSPAAYARRLEAVYGDAVERKDRILR